MTKQKVIQIKDGGTNIVTYLASVVSQGKLYKLAMDADIDLRDLMAISEGRTRLQDSVDLDPTWDKLAAFVDRRLGELFAVRRVLHQKGNADRYRRQMQRMEMHK